MFYTDSTKKIKDEKMKNVRFMSYIDSLKEKIILTLFPTYDETLKFKRKCDAMVYIGGSIFIENKDMFDIKMDIEQTYTDIDYYILGCNFGPYKSQEFFEKYRVVFKNAQDVCFRDRNSYELFSENPKVRVESDIVFNLDANEIQAEQEKKILVSVINVDKRDYIPDKKSYYKKIAEICEQYLNKDYKVELMSFCKTEGDEHAIHKVLKNIKNKNRKKVKVYKYRGNINEALKRIKSSEIIIATRFHAMILGFLFEKKVMPISYSNKTVNNLKDFNYKGMIADINNIEELDINKIAENNYKINF
jgi:colanic acid/amylovoran biosynthesis protein